MGIQISAPLREQIEAALAGLGGAGGLARARAVEGGDINAAHALATDSGRRLFLKTNASAPAGFFECEAEGLRALRETGAIRAPEPLAVGGAGSADEPGDDPTGNSDAPVGGFIIMEFIETAAPAEGFAEDLGRRLAALHRVRGPRFGFASDNFVGLTPQSNAESEMWSEFFARRRFEPMIARLDAKGLATGELRRGVDRIVGKLDATLGGGREVIPSLVHGDLWSGNFLSDEAGAPTLIDPSVHYADREVDLAMTELFGRFDPDFYAAYREAWPLDAGYEERREIYNLYHLLNHLLMFGLSYMTGVMNSIRRLQ